MNWIPYALVGGGAVAMYVIIYLFPFLMPGSWFDAILKERRKKVRAQEKAHDKLRAEAMGVAMDAQGEPYRVLVTRNDIERGATIMLLEHVKDQIADLKRTGQIKHLIRIAYVNWDPDREKLWRDPSLVDYMNTVYQQCPALPYFLTDDSVVPFFELICTAEHALPEHDVQFAPLYDLQTFHDRFVKEAHATFEALGDKSHKEALDLIGDQCVARLEAAINKAWRERTAAMGIIADSMGAGLSLSPTTSSESLPRVVLPESPTASSGSAEATPAGAPQPEPAAKKVGLPKSSPSEIHLEAIDLDLPDDSEISR